MLRVSGSRLGWWSVHPIVIRVCLISVIRSVHALFHLPTWADKQRSSSSVCPTLPFIASLMAIWSRSFIIPIPWSAQLGMLTLPLCIYAWKLSCASKHSYCRFMFFIRTSWQGENWYNVKASSQKFFSLFKSNPLLHELNNVSIVEQ